MNKGLKNVDDFYKEFDETCLPKLAKAFNLDLETLKSELISEKIAYTLYQNKCNDNVLTLAEEKVRYIREKNAKQTTLKLWTLCTTKQN